MLPHSDTLHNGHRVPCTVHTKYDRSEPKRLQERYKAPEASPHWNFTPKDKQDVTAPHYTHNKGNDYQQLKAFNSAHASEICCW